MAEPPTQSQLGRYRLLRVLGRGAMGVVYEGLDPKLNRQVAIKTILKGHLLDDTVASDYSERFVREAHAVARLSHPNIVAVYDFGEQDEAAYIVMEFVDGGELGVALAAGERFELARAVDLVCELLGALAYAHANGVVHRDIKPANVMIDRAGHVKLTDFGVARLADSNTERTVPGTMVGTPSYMAPEQIQGLAVGSRADIFAAGVILYQLLTGRRPFVGDGSWAIQKQIVQEQPALPSSLNAALPTGFDAIVMRALAKDPAQRYETADVFAAELRQALAAAAAASTLAAVEPDATVIRPRLASAATPPPTSTPKAAPPIPGGTARRRWLLPLAIAVLVAGAGGVMLLRQPRGSDQAASPVRAEPISVPAVPASASISVPAVQPAASSVRDEPKLSQALPSASAATSSPPTDRPATSRTASAPASKSAASPSAQDRSAAIRASASRCADLVQRTQLGDTLSPHEQDVLLKECRR